MFKFLVASTTVVLAFAANAHSMKVETPECKAARVAAVEARQQARTDGDVDPRVATPAACVAPSAKG